MRFSRAHALRSMAAGTVFLPSAALAASGADGRLHSDAAPSGAHPWTAVPDGAGLPLGFTIVGDNTAYARPGVFDQAMVQVS